MRGAISDSESIIQTQFWNLCFIKDETYKYYAVCHK